MKFIAYIVASWMGIFLIAINLSAIYPKPAFQGDWLKILIAAFMALSFAVLANSAAKESK